MLPSPIALTCVRGKAGLRVVRAAEEDDVDSVDVTPVVRPKLLVFKTPERKPTSETPGSRALPFAGSPFHLGRTGPPCVLGTPLATVTFYVNIVGGQGVRRSYKHIIPCNLDDVRANKVAAGAMVLNTITILEKYLKQSCEWRCCNCAQPAREVVHTPVSYLAGMPARVVDWAVMVCRTSAGPCRDRVDSSNEDMARRSGLSWINDLPPADIGAVSTAGAPPGCAASVHSAGEVGSEAAAAACTVCHRGVRVVRCPWCLVTRYCTQTCLNKDRACHETACSQICAGFFEGRGTISLVLPVDNIVSSLAVPKQSGDE